MSYSGYLEGDPVIITAALTGGIHGKEANPNLPESPDEIAEAARRVAETGAPIVHLHARRANGERAFDTERFQAITDAVRARTNDLIVQHSTGGTAVPVEERLRPLRTEPPPDMASLDMGPMNRYRHLTSENTRATIDRLYDAMADRGIKPELEVFNDGHLNEVFGLVERRTLDEPVHVTLIFGPGTLTRPHPRNLLNGIDNLPAGATFNTLGFGPHQLPLTTVGMVMGGHIRVGLEDNVYYRRGELAENNAQLVERAARIAGDLERPVATPAEARSILGLS